MIPALDPINDRVFFTRDKGSPISRGGVVLPEGTVSYKWTGTVIAVGPGAIRPLADGNGERFPMKCQVGDRVIVPRNCQGFSLDPEDEKNIIFSCQECELLAIVREETPE